MITAVAFLALLTSPSPAPSATPVCSRDAMPSDIVSPDYPASAGRLSRPVNVVVYVEINPDGSIKSERVTSSSGAAALDQAALMAVRESTYLPKIVDCKAVPGSYIFKATFAP